MKVYGVYLIGFLLLAGCANPYAIMRDGNRAALAKVEVGMSKSQVESTMGTRTAELPDGPGRYENPYKRETVRGTDGQLYDALYYYTQQIGERPIETGLTPVVFYEGRVVGIGWGFLDGIAGATTTTIRRR